MSDSLPRQIHDGDNDGNVFGRSTDKLSFFGATTVVQQTAGTAAPAIAAASSGCTIVASISAQALAAASLANAHATILSNLGLTA